MEDIDNIIEQKAKEIVEKRENNTAYFENVSNAITQVEERIVEKAVVKVNDQKIIEKHSRKLAEISDKAIEAETEKQELVVESKRADNKVRRQEIKNRLIELQTETIRLQKEQKQILKEQKADHKKRNKDAQWQIYQGKLQKMGYTYVPNPFILKMLLCIDGIVSFFEGVGKISTAIMKAIKWIIILGIIAGVLFAIPTTRDWLTGLMGFV